MHAHHSHVDQTQTAQTSLLPPRADTVLVGVASGVLPAGIAQRARHVPQDSRPRFCATEHLTRSVKVACKMPTCILTYMYIYIHASCSLAFDLYGKLMEGLF